MGTVRWAASGSAAALLLLAIVVHVTVDHSDHTGYSARPEPATLLAAKTKTVEASSKALQAKLASVDVGGSLSPAVVQKLAGAVVSGSIPCRFLFAL